MSTIQELAKSSMFLKYAEFLLDASIKHVQVLGTVDGFQALTMTAKQALGVFKDIKITSFG